MRLFGRVNGRVDRFDRGPWLLSPFDGPWGRFPNSRYLVTNISRQPISVIAGHSLLRLRPGLSGLITASSTQDGQLRSLQQLRLITVKLVGSEF